MDPDRIAERQREKEVIKGRRSLKGLHRSSPQFWGRHLSRRR